MAIHLKMREGANFFRGMTDCRSSFCLSVFTSEKLHALLNICIYKMWCFICFRYCQVYHSLHLPHPSPASKNRVAAVSSHSPFPFVPSPVSSGPPIFPYFWLFPPFVQEWPSCPQHLCSHCLPCFKTFIVGCNIISE